MGGAHSDSVIFLSVEVCRDCPCSSAMASPGSYARSVTGLEPKRLTTAWQRVFQLPYRRQWRPQVAAVKFVARVVMSVFFLSQQAQLAIHDLNMNVTQYLRSNPATLSGSFPPHFGRSKPWWYPSALWQRRRIPCGTLNNHQKCAQCLRWDTFLHTD